MKTGVVSDEQTEDWDQKSEKHWERETRSLRANILFCFAFGL